MRFLHLADLHIGKKVNGYSMIEDQRHILDCVLEWIQQKEVDAVIMAGDIYDKPMPSIEAVQLFDAFITKLVQQKLPIFVVSGNHDSVERIGFGADILSATNVYMSKVYEGTMQKVVLQDDYGKLNIYMLPYMKPATVKHIFKEVEMHNYDEAVSYVLQQENVQQEERNILVAHQFVTGAVRSDSEEIIVGGVDCVDVKHFEPFDYVALGHIHRPQQIGRETVRYAGTLLKYSFSEEHQEKSALIIDIKEKGNITFEQIPVTPLRDLKTIKGTFEKITDREFYKDLRPDDYYRVILTDEEDVKNAIGKLKEIYPNIMCMDYDNTRTRAYSVIEGTSIEEEKSHLDYFEEFFSLQNGREMSQEQREYLKKVIEEVVEVQ